MLKRMILMLAVTSAFVATLGFVKFRSSRRHGQAAAFQPPPEAVTTIVAQAGTWPATLNVIGTVAAVQGVTVSADLPGIVDRIAFDSGKSVHEGDVLVELDTRQEQAQLAAVEAQRDLARLNFDRMQGLVSEGAISRAEYDRAAAEQKQTEAGVGEIRATIERKTIRAPFSGILGIRQVNLGQYLSSGDPSSPLQSLDPIYVNFGVPQQQAGQMRVGRQVRITAGDAAGAEFTGEVTAIDSTVDEATRNIQVQATLANPDGTLRPGMFVQTEVALGREPLGRGAAGLRHQLRAVRRFGVRRHRPQGPERQDLPRRAPAVRQARGIARRSGRGRLRRASRGRGRDLRRLQAAQRRRRLSQQQGAAGQQPGPQAGG